MKEGAGEDILTIAWQRPGQALIEVIPANFSSVEIPCPPGWMAVEIKVTADDYPDEISWVLDSKCGTGITLTSHTDSVFGFRTLCATECLPPGKYEFTITDTGGDGIDLEQGRYDIFVNGIINHTGGQFGSIETKTFGECPSSELLTFARKVRVQLKGQNFLHMREVEVWDQNGTNVALNKTATQSSTWVQNGVTYPPSNAVDGVVNIAFTDLSHTSFDQGEYHSLAHDLIRCISYDVLTFFFVCEVSWWEVDFGEDVLVTRVIIYNRIDSNNDITDHAKLVSSRLSNSLVTLRNLQGYTLKAYEIGDATNIAVFNISFDSYIGQPSAPTQSPTVFTPCIGMTVEIKVKTDNFPQEIAWNLVNKCGANFTLSSPPYSSPNKMQSTTACLPSGKYTFTITDEFGDGICCDYGEGEYKILVNGTTVHTGNKYETKETETFGACPTKSPTTFKPSTYTPTSPTRKPTTAKPTTRRPTSPTSKPTTRLPITRRPTSPTTKPSSSVPTEPPTQAYNDCPPGDCGPDSSRACVFPFTYEGNAFDTCTSYAWDQEWCATVGNYVGDDNWRNCCNCPENTPEMYTTPIINLSLSKDEVKNYFIDLYADQEVYCSTDGSDGDTDLYMNIGSVADQNVWDCASEEFAPPNFEECSVTATNPNTVYIAVIAWEAFNGLTFQCTVRTLSTSPTTRFPTRRPSSEPTTAKPTTRRPTSPTRKPTTQRPSRKPTTSKPTTRRPTSPTPKPTTRLPTTRRPTSPTTKPSSSVPTKSPTQTPTAEWIDCSPGDCGPDSSRACVFPFTYEGNAFDTCTSYAWDQEWCATEGNYVGDDNWRNCCNCPTQAPTTEWIDCSPGDCGPDSSRTCVFPFTYEGNEFDTCTSYEWDQEWCATVGNYVGDDNWRNCCDCP
jgi:hypothetical protein